jgi:HAD superfamily hydrolase (TIGR01509 family)
MQALESFIDDDVQALLFDWDGTLADTRQANYEALRIALASSGHHLDESWYAERTGLSTIDLLATFGNVHGFVPDIEQLLRVRQNAYMDSLSTIREVSAVADIARANAGRMPAAIASAGDHETVIATVEYLGMSSWFNATVTKKDVARSKPAPDIFLLAAERLGESPAGCLVFEDTDEGLEAAAAARMRAVDVRAWRDGGGVR